MRITSDIWTVPNAISSFRILIGPACIYFLTLGDPTYMWVALFSMTIAELSDYVDGVVARNYAQQSNVGKVLDPMADSLYRIAIFLAFVSNGWMPIWMFLVILSRDFAVSYLRVMAENSFGTLAARRSGKIKAIVQSASQFIVVLIYAIWGNDLIPSLGYGIYVVLLAATAVTAYSLIDYASSVLRRLA